ncbi:MAG: aminopeptidase, partial [bacterium]|nr:aminopeptidase [bacterium]
MLDYNPLASPHVNFLVVAVLILTACAAPPAVQHATTQGEAEDVHSNANIHAIKVTHLDLDLEVLFDKKVLEGSVTLSFEKTASADSIVLDTRDIAIERAEISADDTTYEPTEFALGPADKILGAPLTIQAPISSGKLRIHYATSPTATAVQWLTPQQTAGRQHPFLFTQSQAIHARSWIPLQDSPAVKTTYSAKIRTPRALRAVMSAGNRPDEPRDGEYDFTMPQAIPSYLIALAVGDIEFRAIG